ncbi:MAG: hypothetical protein GY853_00895 [PVC group bacterium]|nr:hypothetical protein [PVC group bacterium]
MNRFKKVSFLLLFIIYSGYPQKSVEILLLGSQNDIYTIDSVSKITFTGNEMNLEGVNGNYNLNDVQRITFSDNDPTPVYEDVEYFAGKRLENDAVFRSNLKSTYISFILLKSSKVNVSVYNSIGQKVVNLLSGENIGSISLEWTGKDSYSRNVSNGVYTAIIEINGNVQSKQIVILR